MVVRRIAAVVLTLLASAVLHAGAIAPASLVIEVNFDHSGSASGDMVTVRTSRSKIERIGCGVKGFDFGDLGSDTFGLCWATDDNNLSVSCFTDNKVLLDVIGAGNPYSYIRFDFNAEGICTRIDFSTQSIYLPSNITSN